MSLAGNRCHNVSELLEVYQAIDLVFCCETARGLLFVLVSPRGNVVGYADIKSSRQACHDVDVVGFQDPKDRGSSAALRLPLNDRIRTQNSQTRGMTKYAEIALRRLSLRCHTLQQPRKDFSRIEVLRRNLARG